MASISSFVLCIKLVKIFVRNFPLWLSTPINNPPKSGDQQNKKAYKDPPDLFLPSPSKNGKKRSGDETTPKTHPLLKLKRSILLVMRTDNTSFAAL